MRIIRCQQQSDLWHAARRGRITGTGIANIMAPPITRQSTRKGRVCVAGTEAACREDYRRELVIERVYKRASDHYVSRAMQDGSEREPYARMLYEAERQQELPGLVVELVGFALHPSWDWFGCSADGLCGQIGGVELKCPTELVHDSYVSDPAILVEEYKWQVLGNLICFPEREWWDLMSFNPFAPDEIKTVRHRFHRSDWTQVLASIEDAAEPFHLEVEAEIAKRNLPPTEFDVMPKDDEPEADSGENGFDPNADAFAYLDSQELIP